MKKRIAALLLVALTLLIAVAGVWLKSAAYTPQEEALACMNSPEQGIDVFGEGSRLVFAPEQANAGLVFYPGGNVEPESYAPLMTAFAKRGIFCVLMKMPLNLAILNMDAAAGVTADYPSVSSWYIGGHSLGGFAASNYLAENSEDYEGLILLGAYTQSDLTASGLRALSIYGSEDGVLNMENYKSGLPLLPEGYTEIVIDGGCHAYFGAYGEQEGDGIPTISREMQMEVTADAVEAFVFKEQP